MNTETLVHHHTILRYIPTLLDTTATLCLVLEAVEEVAEAIDPEIPPDDGQLPGTDPEGAQALRPIVDALYKAVFDLREITDDA
jgi:hypothetical protein